MKIKKHVYKILIIVLISVLVAGAATFLLLEIAGLPNCDIDSREEAITKFTAYFDGINAILERYGLHTTTLPDAPGDFGKVVGDNDECKLYAYVYLEDGESMYISLEWEYGYPADFYLSLEGAPCDDVMECALGIEQYPYVYEIAEYLCDGRFSAGQYQEYLVAAKECVEQWREPDSEYLVSKRNNLESALFYLGSFSYRVFEENDMWRPEMRISMPLYE